MRALPSDRAVVNGAGQAVSALRASVPSAASLPVISLWQPFASLIFQWNSERGDCAKCFETRAFPLPKRLIGQRVAIHATAKFPASRHISEALNDLCYQLWGCGYNYTLPFGAIIGTVRFGTPIPTGEEAAFQPESEIAAGDWTPGRWAWPIIEVCAIQPVPMKGKQGWWRVPAQAIEARRAETGTGSVHESAVGEADAPDLTRIPPTP